LLSTGFICRNIYYLRRPYNGIDEKYEGKDHLTDIHVDGRIAQHNIGLMKLGSEGVHRIHVARNGDRCLVLVIAVLDFRFRITWTSNEVRNHFNCQERFTEQRGPSDDPYDRLQSRPGNRLSQISWLSSAHPSKLQEVTSHSLLPPSSTFCYIHSKLSCLYSTLCSGELILLSLNNVQKKNKRLRRALLPRGSFHNTRATYYSN
jgi:hypothetical protein